MLFLPAGPDAAAGAHAQAQQMKSRLCILCQGSAFDDRYGVLRLTSNLSLADQVAKQRILVKRWLGPAPGPSVTSHRGTLQHPPALVS